MWRFPSLRMDRFCARVWTIGMTKHEYQLDPRSRKLLQPLVDQRAANTLALILFRGCQWRQELRGNRLATGLKPYCGEKDMTDDPLAHFCYKREQRHGSLVAEESADQVDDFGTLLRAEGALMDLENLGAICICCVPDPQHMSLMIPANATGQRRLPQKNLAQTAAASASSGAGGVRCRTALRPLCADDLHATRLSAIGDSTNGGSPRTLVLGPSRGVPTYWSVRIQQRTGPP